MKKKQIYKATTTFFIVKIFTVRFTAKQSNIIKEFVFATLFESHFSLSDVKTIDQTQFGTKKKFANF